MRDLSRLYSVRMRAAAGGSHEARGQHVSGAEKLAPGGDLATVVRGLLYRPSASTKKADFVRVAVDPLSQGPITVPCLPVRQARSDAGNCERLVRRLLGRGGIREEAIAAALRGLRAGFRPAGALRGAAVLDMRSGDWLNRDAPHGCRATQFDCHPGEAGHLTRVLSAAGLSHPRTREALLLATRVAWAGAAAELGWSDDPGYAAGYVASAEIGYVRLPDSRPFGAVGGRVFFLDPQKLSLAEFTRRLREPPLWIVRPFRVR